MFCSQCGAQAGGNFCSACGSRLANIAGGASPTHGPAEPSAPAFVEADLAWENDVRYDAVVRQREVRSLVDRHAAQARSGLSAEQYLAFCDAVLPLPVSLEKLAAAAQPIYERIGYGVRRQRNGAVLAPVGRVMLRLLCSLARHSQKLKAVQQSDEACQFEAELPSGFRTMHGHITVTLRRDGAHTQVAAHTKYMGQLYDWGKSQQVLEELFTDLQQDPA